MNEIAEKTSSSDEECNLIQSFDSCDEFEIMSFEQNTTSIEEVNEYIKKQLKQKAVVGAGSKDIQKVEIRRSPRSQQIKSLNALVWIDHQIMNMTNDTGSPVSFLNWTTAKQILESSKNTKFIPRESLFVSTICRLQ